jgi:Lon protease-like protein
VDLLPLFPLDTVLFPGTPLTLHIFEPRYRQMMRRCLEEGLPFGVVLIREGVEALGPLARPHEIGCTARITRVEPLDDGRMNILAVGDERFRIEKLRSDEPYLVGEVAMSPLPEPEDSPAIEGVADALRGLLATYLAALARASEGDIGPMELPEEPLALAYLAAWVLQVPASQKQPLLVARDAAELLARLRELYRNELPLLETMIEHRGRRQSGPFSLN